MKNTDKLVMLAKEKSENTKQKVITTIDEMVKNGDRITFYSVYQKAGVSKSFVYSNNEIREVISKYRNKPIKRNQSKDAKDVIIDSLKLRIRELENENRLLIKDESWKDKYEALLVEVDSLRKQLEKAYKY